MSWMDDDNYGDSGGPFYGSNDSQDSYYTPDDQYQSVATVSGDNSYALPDTYEMPNLAGYGDNSQAWGQTSNIDYSQYNPYEGDVQDQLGLTPNQSIDPQQSNWLQQLFSGGSGQATPGTQGQGGGTTNFLSQLFGSGGKLLAGLMEGRQNKQKQSAYNQITKNPALDPFGSQRPFYQEQAKQAVIDPYSNPMVKAQIDNVQRMQNIKDAAAGRRSNSIASQPGVMAEQARIAMAYQNQMAQQGGAGFGPDGKSIAAALMGGANAGINGYASPLASALGYTNQSSENNDQLVNALKQLIANGK